MTDPEEATHCSYGGTRLWRAGGADEATLHEWVAFAYKQGLPCTVCERQTAVGKFAFDIDVHGEFYLLQQERLWFLVMEHVLRQADLASERAIGWATKLAHCALLLDSSGFCARTCAPHTGLHVVFPSVVLPQAEAETKRLAVVDALNALTTGELRSLQEGLLALDPRNQWRKVGCKCM